MVAGRRSLLIALGCLALAGAGYELWPRDERQIESLLDRLCSQLNQTRDPASLRNLRLFLGEALEPAVAIRADELAGEIDGLSAARERAEGLLSGPPLGFALNGVQVRVSGNLARADADLLITVRGSGEQRREVRRTRVRLAKVKEPDGSRAVWQIEAIEVDAVLPSEPEARP